MAETLNYANSPVPQGRFSSSEITPDRAIRTIDGQFSYDSASASGDREIFLPALPGSPTSEERLLARNFGEHVATRIEQAFKKPSYLKSGAQQRPSQVFRHFTSVAKGASLADADTLKRMEGVAREFEQTDDPESFFKEIARPYLHSLSAERRR